MCDKILIILLKTVIKLMLQFFWDDDTLRHKCPPLQMQTRALLLTYAVRKSTKLET